MYTHIYDILIYTCRYLLCVSQVLLASSPSIGINNGNMRKRASGNGSGSGSEEGGVE